MKEKIISKRLFIDICFKVDFVFQGFVLHVVSAACEWLMCVSQLAFFLTFVREFKEYSMSAPEVCTMWIQYM